MLIETVMEANGDTYTPIELHRCDRCGTDLPYNAPREQIGGKDYCGDCSFIMGLIDEKQYLKDYMFWLCIPNLRAAVYEGKVYVEPGKFPWERESTDRNYAEYVVWRTKVFERDNYTCRKCGQWGGELNAHHIKPYAKYPDLRTKLDNGITLCVKCHREAHKRKAATNG